MIFHYDFFETLGYFRNQKPILPDDIVWVYGALGAAGPRATGR